MRKAITATGQSSLCGSSPCPLSEKRVWAREVVSERVAFLVAAAEQAMYLALHHHQTTAACTTLCD